MGFETTGSRVDVFVLVSRDGESRDIERWSYAAPLGEAPALSADSQILRPLAWLAWRLDLPPRERGSVHRQY